MTENLKHYYNKEYYYTSCGNYDKFSDSKNQKFAWAYRRALDLAENIGENSKVLDISCGRGEVLHLCALKNALVYGIDYSPDAVEIAKDYIRKFPGEKEKVQIKVMNCTSLDFPDNFFSHVFMLDIVEHLEPKDLQKSLNEAKRVLKPGGKLIIHTNPNRLQIDYGFKYYTRHVNYLINKLFNKNLWTKMEQIRTPLDQTLHINEQTYFSLKNNLRSVFENYKVWLEFSSKHMPFWWKLSRSVTTLYPISLVFPFNQFFCNWLWAVAKKNE